MRIIHEDLIEGILARLAVKDLLRFRCVCKAWLYMIDCPTFIHTHYNHQFGLHKSQGTTPLFLWRHLSFPINLDDLSICHLLYKNQSHEHHDVLVNITLDLERDSKLVLNYPGDLTADSRTCFVYSPGIANGIVCLHMELDFQNGLNQYGVSWKDFCGLWNPATRDFKILPDIDAPDQLKPPQFTIVCFGFVHFSNDFKLVARFFIESDGISSPIEIYDDPIAISSAYELYSLSTNSWKRLPYFDLYFDPSCMDACLNDVQYWTATKQNYHFKFCIVSFNFRTEVFKVLDPPQRAALPQHCLTSEFDQRIALYKECLALIFTRRISDEAVAKVDIWVATKFDDVDFGVPLEWQCLLVIEPFPTSIMTFCVMTARMDGHLLLKTSDADPEDNEWSLYDPETRKIKNLGIRWLGCCFQYVESLFLMSRRTTQSNLSTLT